MSKPEWWNRVALKIVRRLENLFIADYPIFVQLLALTVAILILGAAYLIKSKMMHPALVYWASGK